MIRTTVFFAALALAVAACGMREGDSCSSPKGKCTSATEALACVDGVIKRVSCRGAAACKDTGSKLSCDQSLANEGDACIGSGSACSVDRKAFLTCRDGKFVRGADCPQGCIVSGDRATCPAPEILPPLR